MSIQTWWFELQLVNESFILHFYSSSKITCEQVIGFPSRSMAPSATMMMFNLWPESLASLNFLQSFSGQLISGGHSGMKTKSASETMAATWNARKVKGQGERNPAGFGCCPLELVTNLHGYDSSLSAKLFDLQPPAWWIVHSPLSCAKKILRCRKEV